MADISSLFLQTTKPTVIFRSQITPDFTFSLTPGQAPTPVQVEPTPSGQLAYLMLKYIVRPEVEITAAGFKQAYSPYGKPTENYITPIIVGLGVGAAMFGGAIYLLSRRRKRKS